MKTLFKFILLILFVCGTPGFCAEKVLVLPADIVGGKENVYRFPEASEMIALDTINYLNRTGKISAQSLREVWGKINADITFKSVVNNSLVQYKNTGQTDFTRYKKVSQEFGVNYILIISSNVVTKENSMKRGLWEILQLGSNFDIRYPFELETRATLIDVSSELVMWSRVYSKEITNNNGVFAAKTYSQALEHLENAKMYSRDMLSADIAQNVVLKFYPKSIRDLPRANPPKDAMPVMRYDNRAPKPIKIDEMDYGEIIFGL